jgi:hypothetical protein
MSNASAPLSSAELHRLAELAEKLRDNALADAEVPNSEPSSPNPPPPAKPASVSC